jgi:uncharacterized protein YcaQ
MKIFPREAAARLFLSRQHLDAPRSRTLSAAALARFVADAGGLQLDSINVVARAHELTLWSRFGAYDRAELDRLVYERRALFEYWAHAACLVAEEDRPAWARAMADYRTRHTGWSDWLKANPGVTGRVIKEIRARGPLSSSDFERPSGKSSGWWDWKPAHHALHYLWMSGRLAVHSRRHFQKRYELADKVLPRVAPIPRLEFPRWHLRKTLRALGAAAEADLPRYLTFPRLDPALRRRALKRLLQDGEAVEVRVEGLAGRWYALAADVSALENPPPTRGTTLLSPFDSLLWHRGRAKALFGFDYKIEVYVPAPKRVHGYYSLPILHDGRLIGRLDAKNRREERALDVLSVHFESPPSEAERAGLGAALESLARFLGAERWRGPRSGAILPA